MHQKKIFLVAIMVGLLFMSSACGKKKNNNQENNNNPVNPTPTPVENVGPIANTNDAVVYEANIDGLQISNVSLISNAGSVTYTGTVTNNNAQDVYVLSFNIIMRDIYGNELNTVAGYVGETLAPGESATMTTNLFTDINAIASIEYTRNY